jgi:hypothetical protein
MTGAHVCASLGAELLLVDRHATEPLAQQPRQRAAQGGGSGLRRQWQAEVAGIAAANEPVDALVLAAGDLPLDTGGSWPRTR